MKFSAQEEYGLRCLLAIASKGTGASLTIPEISRMEGLSEPHVAKLLSILRKEGFINSTRGHAGGYALAKPATEIPVATVLEVLGGKLFEDSFCERHSGLNDTCSRAVSCGLKSLWSSIQGAVDSVLKDVSLADLLPPSVTPISFYNQPRPRDVEVKLQ